jgi:hypothetical protein
VRRAGSEYHRISSDSHRRGWEAVRELGFPFEDSGE